MKTFHQLGCSAQLHLPNGGSPGRKKYNSITLRRPKLVFATPKHCGLLNVRKQCASRNGAKRPTCLHFPVQKLCIEAVWPAVSSRLQKKHPHLTETFTAALLSWQQGCLFSYTHHSFTVALSIFNPLAYDYGDCRPTFSTFCVNKHSGLTGIMQFANILAVVKCLSSAKTLLKTQQDNPVIQCFIWSKNEKHSLDVIHTSLLWFIL